MRKAQKVELRNISDKILIVLSHSDKDLSGDLEWIERFYRSVWDC